MLLFPHIHADPEQRSEPAHTLPFLSSLISDSRDVYPTNLLSKGTF